MVAETAGSGWVTLGAGLDVAFAEGEATFGSFGVMVVMASPAQKRAPCPFLPHLVHFFSLSRSLTNSGGTPLVASLNELKGLGYLRVFSSAFDFGGVSFDLPFPFGVDEDDSPGVVSFFDPGV